jgi:hypothetical protein
MKEAAEDVFFGQVVIIWARWFLIVAGTVLALWTTQKSSELAVAVVPIAALMAMNFYLHGRYLTERPSNELQIAAASLLDLFVITCLVRFWHGPDVGSGLASPFVVFYYPMCWRSRSCCRDGSRSATRRSRCRSTRSSACRRSTRPSM